MRLVLRLALPVGLLMGAMGASAIFHMATGANGCSLWFAPIMPHCW
jgi:hypothetical protein